MELTPSQSVKIFGWWAQPRLTLAWEDIKTNNLSWRHLRELGLQPHQLQRVQPDKMQWIQRGGLHPRDILDMTVFPVNPLTDFRVDLAELWNLQCSPEQLLEMNVTFEQLLERVRQRYGVQPHYLAAFWAIESNFGSATGGFSVLQALLKLPENKGIKQVDLSEPKAPIVK